MQFVTARTRALIVATVLILAISIIVPVSAKKTPYYKASGTIDSYVGVTSSEIVSGRWSVTVKGDDLTYKAMFKELNLDADIEDSPVGSVDIFTHTFTPDGFVITGDTLVFWGTMHVKKVWRKLDWTTEVVRWDTYPVTITITPDSFFLDSPPPGPWPGQWDQDWDREGTTTHFKREGETPEISIHDPDSTTYIVYDNSPTNIRYEFSASVNVYSRNGVESVTMTPPEGDPVYMTYEGPTEYPDIFSKYTVRLELLSETMLGTYKFVAEDVDDNTAELDYDVTSWIDVTVDSYTPIATAHLPGDEPVVWNIIWGPDAPDFETYNVALYYKEVCIWNEDFTELPIEYNGSPLTGTEDYGWDIYAIPTPYDNGEVKIRGHFFLDFNGES